MHLSLFRLNALRGGLAMLFAQNLILMGVFFTVPLYLQIVNGFNALDTGVRMLPASLGLFIAALAGSKLSARMAARPIVRIGLAITFAATLLLLGTVEPRLDTTAFLVAMGLLGIGMGLVTSQLGNVVQSAVGENERSEAGGLQNTSQQIGSSFGTAFLGAIVITGLIAAFSNNIAGDENLPRDVRAEVQTRISAGTSFVSADQVRRSANRAGLSSQSVDRVVSSYEDAQLKALKTAFLFAAGLVLLAGVATRRLPTRRFDELAAKPAEPDAAAATPLSPRPGDAVSGTRT